MGIIYLISIGILLISFIAFKKTSKQINIISFISISVVTLFCYQAFLCYLFTFVGIPITLEILTMVNLLIAVSFIVLIIRKKEYQKYSIDKLDVLSVSIIAIVVLVVSYLNFGFPFDVNYETGDPSVHYLTAVMFAKSDALLAVEKEPDAVYSNFNTRKTVSYVNSGLLMKSLCPELEPMDCYHVFVSFGILTLFLTGMSLYAAMRNLAKKKEHILYALIIALIALLGYPLNSLLFGFEYLSMGLLIICTIIDFIYYYEENLLKLPPFVIVMSLLNFGLFSSYYMFVPFVYPALWIYFCLMQYRRTKKIITKPLLLLLIVTLLIPFILGYIYHIEPQFYGIFNKEITNLSHFDQQASHLLNEGLSTKGYIYINLYSNMLLLIPLVLYLLVKDIKEHQLKRDSFILLLLGFLLIFLGILFVGHQFGKVSTYYLSKNYFALWLVLLYCNAKALIVLSEKNNYLPRLFIGGYVFLMIVCTIFSNVRVRYGLNNNDETPLTVMEIFGANKTILLNKPREFNQEEIEILMYVRNHLDYHSKIEVVTDENAYYWQYVLLNYINKEDFLKEIQGAQAELKTKLILLEKKINKVDYMVYFTKSDAYQALKEKLFENSELVYENAAGGIIRYKK